MSKENTCPICSKKFSADEGAISDNGNYICQECAEKELDDLIPTDEKS
ncbi:hypothetical protein AAEU42_10145 [Pseudoflavonifractor phocaeensis]